MTGSPAPTILQHWENEPNHGGGSTLSWQGSPQEAQRGQRIKVAWVITGGNPEVQAADRNHVKVDGVSWGPQFCRMLRGEVADGHRSSEV